MASRLAWSGTDMCALASHCPVAKAVVQRCCMLALRVLVPTGLLTAGTVDCSTSPSSGAPALGLCVIAPGQLTLHPAHKLGCGVHYPPPGSAMSPTDLGEHLLSPSSLAPLLSHQWGCTAVSSGLWARSCLAPHPCLVRRPLQLDPSSPSGPYLGAAAPAVGVTC